MIAAVRCRPIKGFPRKGRVQVPKRCERNKPRRTAAARCQRFVATVPEVARRSPKPLPAFAAKSVEAAAAVSRRVAEHKLPGREPQRTHARRWPQEEHVEAHLYAPVAPQN